METLENQATCIDTSILIDVLRSFRQGVDLVRRLEQESALLSTTAINAFELYYGTYKTRKLEKNVKATRELLSRLVVLDFAEGASEEAGKVLAQLEAKGELVEFRDVLIGSIARVHGHALITKNPRHFHRIPGLRVLEAQY